MFDCWTSFKGSLDPLWIKEMFIILITNSLPLKSFFLNFELFFDLQKSCKNSTKPFVSFTLLSLMFMSYLTTVEQEQEINIHTILLIKLQTLLEFHHFLH